jgi:hypothetical protein
MDNSTSPSEDNTHSFVLRIWEEEPGQRRGTIRHVQSQSKRGFTKLSQAFDFIERHLSRISSRSASEHSASGPLIFLSGRRLRMARQQMAAMAAGLLVLFVFGITMFAPQQSDILLGTTVESGQLASGISFLAGILAGVLLAALWQRARG